MTSALDCPAFLAFVRRLPCVGCCAMAPSVAHHWPMRSRGVVDDSRSMPVCIRCHQRAHGITVVLNGERLGPPTDEEQTAAADATFRVFIEHATPEELEQYFSAHNAKKERPRAVAW